jgi:hypothetical protein
MSRIRLSIDLAQDARARGVESLWWKSFIVVLFTNRGAVPTAPDGTPAI